MATAKTEVAEVTTGYSAFSFDMPPEPQDVPPAKGGVRRVDLDGGKWVDIRSSGNQTDHRFVQWWWGELAKANDLEPDAREARTLELNAYIAKFIGDRVMAHNLTYPGSDEVLPTGYEMFWEMQTIDVMTLIGFIQNPPNQIVRLQDPKSEPASTNG